MSEQESVDPIDPTDKIIVGLAYAKFEAPEIREAVVDLVKELGRDLVVGGYDYSLGVQEKIENLDDVIKEYLLQDFEEEVEREVDSNSDLDDEDTDNEETENEDLEDADDEEEEEDILEEEEEELDEVDDDEDEYIEDEGEDDGLIEENDNGVVQLHEAKLTLSKQVRDDRPNGGNGNG